MNVLLPFIKQLLILYAIGFIGLLAKRKQILTNASDTALMRMVLTITLPCLIISSLDFPFSHTLMKDFFWLFTISAYALGTACAVGFVLRKMCQLPDDCKTPFEGIIIFGNQGFIGYAICGFIFGREGIIYATIFNILYLILIWTYGIYLFTRHNPCIQWREIFLNPGIVTTFIGILLFLTPLTLLHIPSETLAIVGSMTTPLSMIIIGSLLGNMNWISTLELVRNKHIWLSSMMKLLLVPALLFVFSWLPLSFSVIAVAVLLTGMPSAPTISLYAMKYGGNASFSSAGVAVSTFLSIITLPVLYAVLHWLF